MQSDAEKRRLIPSSQESERPHKTRTRIGAACVRCQKRKIRCDALLPACGACQKAGTECVGGGTAREIPRSYVNDLEARVEWLESIIREKAPEVDLGATPGRREINNSETPVLQDEPPNSAASGHQDDGIISSVSEQIGMISIAAGADLRYLGPSSGLFFTKFVMAGLGKNLRPEKGLTSNPVDDQFSVPAGLLVVEPKELPSDQRQARWLSQAYFETVHLQYPFLHEPTHQETIQKMYDGVEVGPVLEFQVFMVLAVGATILSRRAKVQLSAEGYCASATNRLESISQTTSLSTVQCILLLEMYALNNPSSGLRLWPLHYQSLALTIELGLHRKAPRKSFTIFEEQLRTRVFWCVYTIDRLLCTLMGRPLGVVDEQCDLRFPMDVNDHDLRPEQQTMPSNSDLPSTMSTSIHLSKHARLCSEAKCILYCADREYPPYTQPVVTNVEGWREDMMNRIEQWKKEIPRHPEGSPQHHINLFCEVKYHELVMLILRPNPYLQQPEKALVRKCFWSAMNCSKLYHRLYTTKALHYGWVSVHSLFMCGMVMFYCVWTAQGIADEVNLDCLMRSLRASSDILSAMGEYWPEATRSRDILDRVSTATIRRFTQNNKLRNGISPPDLTNPVLNPTNSEQPPHWPGMASMSNNTAPFLFPQATNTNNSSWSTSYGTQDDSFVSTDLLSFLLGPVDGAEGGGPGMAGEDIFGGLDEMMW